MKFNPFLLLVLFSLSLSQTPTRAASQTGPITRQVLLPDGKVAAGADVTLHLFEGQDIKTTTDKRGYFSLSPSPNARLYNALIIVDVPGCSLTFTPVRPGLGLEQNIQKINLVKDNPRVGKVIGADEKAVADAEVILTIYGFGAYYNALILQSPHHIKVPQLVTHTDEQGNFSLRGLNLQGKSEQDWRRDGMSGWAKATIAGKTWLGRWRDAERKNEDEPFLIQLKPTVTVRGKIVDDETKKPIVGAEINYEGYSAAPEFTQTLLSANDGLFELKDLPLESVGGKVFQISRSNQKPIIVSFKNTPNSDIEREFVLSLPSLVKFSGRITDSETGKPLPNEVKVRVQSRQKNDLAWDVIYDQKTKTDANSKFDLLVPPGFGRLYLEANLNSISTDLMSLSLSVPKTGLQSVDFKVSIPPLYRVQFKNLNKERLKLYQRTVNGEEELSYERGRDGHNELTFFAQDWGETMEIRGVDLDHQNKELFGWTKVVAVRDLTPNVIELKK